MASIRSRSGSNLLFVDFHYMGKRCRETTNLTDTPANRKKLAKVIEKMEAEMVLGSFRYSTYFPKSDKAAYFEELKDRAVSLQADTPLFRDFAEIWFEEKKIEWRATYQSKIRTIMKKYLIPAFAKKALFMIDKSDVLAFRSSLAKVTYKNAKNTLSAARINSIMTTLSMILKMSRSSKTLQV